MKVLIFHPALAPYRVDFFNELGKLCDLHIVFLTRNNANQAFDQEELLKNATYSYSYLDKHYVIVGRNINLGFDKEIETHNPDVVICTEFGMSLWAVFYHRLLHSRKYKVFTTCDDSEDVAERRKGIRKLVSRFFKTRIDGVISVNPLVGQRLAREGVKQVILFPIIHKASNYKNKLNKAVAITNNYIHKYDLEHKKCVLYVGRLTKVKNLESLILAFIEQLTDEPSARLIIVGDGDQKLELEKLVRERTVDSKVLFVGRYEGEELLAWYNLSAFLGLVSLYEPFGAVVGEALLAGQQVLVSDKVGAKCLVNTQNGMVCQADSTEDIAAKMREMMKVVQPVSIVSDLQKSLLPYDFDELMRNMVKQLEHG